MLHLSERLVVMPTPVLLLRSSSVSHPERAVARGELTRVRRGVFAPAEQWASLPPWDRYLARVHAVALMYPHVVFSHESAAALLGMPIFGDPHTVHVLVHSAAAAGLISGVRTHRAVADRTIVEIGGMALTSPLDVAVDLARHRHNAIGLAAADAALRVDPTLTAAALTAANEARESSRGRNIARWPLHRASVRAETALESISRATIEWLGYPAPHLQVTFLAETGEEDRCDFVWGEPTAGTTPMGIVGEADGDLKYDGRFGDARDVLRRQSRRDARLRERVRCVTHWGWYEATAVGPLRSILHGSGLRAVAPENAAQLFTLRQTLAPRAPHRTDASPTSPARREKS